MSTSRCRDNAPEGYRDLSEAHTPFGSSGKKADQTKRGRFNAGEKFVLVMCESARVTSTTGQIIFQSNGKRKETDLCTEAGTEFQGVLEMTGEEWNEVGRQVQLLFPPILTTYNGVAPGRLFLDIIGRHGAEERGACHLNRLGASTRGYSQPTAYQEHDFATEFPYTLIQCKSAEVGQTRQTPLQAKALSQWRVFYWIAVGIWPQVTTRTAS